MIEKLITEYGNSAIQKEELVLVEKQFKDLQRKNEILEEENKLLKKNNGSSDNFKEYRGVFIRQEANGQIYPDAYCPNCKIVMTSLNGLMPFRCSKCGRRVSINGSDLEKYLLTVSKL